MTIRSTRREFLGATASASALLMTGVGVRPALAQYPERNLSLIVPYGAGGGTDITARLLARDLEPVLGKPVTVENRGGGGGWIGWGALAAAKPDGYTIGYLNVPSMYAGYLDPAAPQAQGKARELHADHQSCDRLQCLGGEGGQPVQDRQGRDRRGEEEARDDHGVAYGAGSDDHIAILGIEAETGTKYIIVHSKSTAEAKTQALGGHIQVLAANVSEVAEEVRAGQFRLLGVMSPERSRFLPQAPTFKEQGFNQVWSVTRGIAAPANLDKKAEATLTAALAKVIDSREHQEKAEKLSLQPLVIRGADYVKFLKDNEQATKKLMKW